MVSVFDVTKLIIYLANKYGDLITNLRLQKLLYYTQVWHLVNFNKEPLFDDEIKAWNFGPVVEEVYRKFKNFRHTPISLNVKKDEITKKFNKETIDFVEFIYGKYSSFSAYDLVNMTHNEEPWIDANKNDLKIIDRDKMYEYYSELCKQNKKKH